MIDDNNAVEQKDIHYFKTTMFNSFEGIVFDAKSISFQFDLIKNYIEENCGLSDEIIDTLDLSQGRLFQMVSDLYIFFQEIEIVRL